MSRIFRGRGCSVRVGPEECARRLVIGRAATTTTATTKSCAAAAAATRTWSRNSRPYPWCLPAQQRQLTCVSRQRQRRLLTIDANTSPREELLEIRERLRGFGSETNINRVTLQKASELSSQSSSLLSQLRDTTAVLTLDHVAARNALTGKMMAELADAVDLLQDEAAAPRSSSRESSSLVALVVRGAGHFFCAGADLSVAAAHLSTPAAGREMSRLMTDTAARLRRLPLVTVAALRGMAVGGGAELLVATDFRLAAGDARIRFVHAKMGVTPGWGGATRLVPLVGRQRALQLLGTARSVDATQALAWGLVDEIVAVEPQDKDQDNHEARTTMLMEQALVQFLDPYVQHSHPSVLHAAKRVVAGVDDAATYEEAAHVEHSVFCTMWGGPANRDAVLASRMATKQPEPQSEPQSPQNQTKDTNSK